MSLARRYGVSNVVAGILLAIAAAGALTLIIQWARTQVSSMPSRVAEGVTVAAYRIGADLVVVNYGSRTYTARVVDVDGKVCGSLIQLQPGSTAVITASCEVRWVEVDGNLVEVVETLR